MDVKDECKTESPTPDSPATTATKGKLGDSLMKFTSAIPSPATYDFMDYSVVKQIHTTHTTTVALVQHGKTGVASVEKYDAYNYLHLREREVYDVLQQDGYHHPHILNMLGHNGISLIQLEYAPMSSLAQYVKHQVLNTKDIQDVTKQVVAALQYMHSKDLICVDLKTDNILVTNTEDPFTVKLCDFQLVKHVAECNTALPAGTMGCLAPETERECILSVATDAWQLGIMLYELLTCQFDPVWNALGNIKFPYYMPICPGEAKEMCNALLCVDATKRLSIATVMTHPYMTMDYSDLP